MPGKKKINVGDVIKVKGQLEEKEIFLVQSWEMVEKWRDQHPNESFCPIPPAKKEVVKSDY